MHHRDHENRTGCRIDRVAFMEEVWTVVQSYGTQSILKIGLNRPLLREVLDKLDECEGRLSELLIDSVTYESEANSPIKMTPQEDKRKVVCLSRTRKGTMRSKMVSDRINEKKMKLSSKVTLRKTEKTKVDSKISMKAVNSAKRKRIEEAMDLGQGDDRLPGTDRMLTDVAMVPPILMAGIKSASYTIKKSDRTLTGATLEMEILSRCVESTLKDFKSSPMNQGKGSVVGQLVPVEYNPSLNEDIRDCFFDYEQAVLFRFWRSRIATIRSAANQQTKLGLILEEKVTAPSVPKSEDRVEFGLGFSDELLRTRLMVVWELMKPTWCPSLNADSILRATQDVQRELNSDCNLRDLNIIYNLMTTASKSNGEDKVELRGWRPDDWVELGSCLAEVCGLDGDICGDLDCVKIMEKQHKQ